MNPVLDLSENLTSRPGNVVLPAWLAGAFVRACGGMPWRNFERDFPRGPVAVGVDEADFVIFPYLVAEWRREVAETAGGPHQARVHSVALRNIVPADLAPRLDHFCPRLFGLRVVSGGSGVAEPFFESENVENLAAGNYSATLGIRDGMLGRLLGQDGGDLPAIVVPRRLWDDLDAQERAWLVVVEVAAHWKFSWIRKDGCVETVIAPAVGEPLSAALKPLASLGRKLVAHGWLTNGVDDAPVLFEPGIGAGGIRLLWQLHPSRVELPRPARAILPVAPSAKETNPAPAQDAFQSKMRLVAAEELKKIRSGFPAQYAQLKQRYLNSLDPQGLQLIRNLEQMLAPPLLEEHLHHNLVRYMIEHPSAWQSAGSGKPAH